MIYHCSISAVVSGERIYCYNYLLFHCKIIIKKQCQSFIFEGFFIDFKLLFLISHLNNFEALL